MAWAPLIIYISCSLVFSFIILDLSIISIISRIHLILSASEGSVEDVVGVQSELELIADEVVGDGDVLRGIM